MRAETSVKKIHQFMVALGKAVSSPGRIYFTGGVSAVLLGWRETPMFNRCSQLDWSNSNDCGSYLNPSSLD